MHPFASHVKHHGKVKLRALGGKTPHNMHDVDSRIKRAIHEHDKDLHSPGHGHTGHTDLKAAGFKGGGRLDKRARGGGTKHRAEGGEVDATTRKAGLNKLKFMMKMDQGDAGGRSPYDEQKRNMRASEVVSDSVPRKARGGGTKHKHHTSIVIAPPAGPRPPMATPAANPMPPPGMSGGPMPSPMMQKRGGSVHKKHYAHGGRTYTEGEMPKNKEAWAGYYKKNSYAKGGSVKPAPMKYGTPGSGMDEGQGTGEHRIEYNRYIKKRGI